MEESSKIYIAGHNGLVGSALFRKLKSHGYKNILTRDVKELDLRRQNEVEHFFEFEKPDYVFLAAAKVGGINANSTYKAEFIYDNIMIAANVIHAAYQFGVKKLLNLGSSCIYPKNAPQPLKEEYLLTSSLEPTNEPYAIAKISAIKLCRYYNEQYGTNFISVMPTNLYGPNDNFDIKTSHVLPALIRKFHLAKLLANGSFEAIKKDLAGYGNDLNLLNLSTKNIVSYLNSMGIYSERLVLWGTGMPFREFLFGDDLVDALLLIMRSVNKEKIGEFINIGSGKDISINDLSFLVKDIVGFKGQVDFDPSYPDGTLKKCLDVSRINCLGWKSSISLFNGIRLVYNYYLKK